MNDLAYVQATASTKSESGDCPRCHLPVLCARHVVEMTALRRERVATLLRPAAVDHEQAA